MMSCGTTATVSSGGEAFPCIYHSPCISNIKNARLCLLGADLAGCGNDDANYGPLPWETVCPAVRIVRMGTSGKVRGMRD